MSKTDRIIFNPSLFNTDIFNYNIPFKFTDSEKNVIGNLYDDSDLQIYMDVFPNTDKFSIILHCKGILKLIDSHTLDIVDYSLNDSVDLNIFLNDEKNSDIEKDQDGYYSLRGSILALLYSAIPQNYSLTKLSKIETDSYTLMSEDEYFKLK